MIHRHKGIIKMKSVESSWKNLFSCAVGVLFIIGAILLFPNPKRTEKNINLSDYSSVSSICELATLKSYYHNVALYDKEQSNGEKILNTLFFWPFDKFTKIGQKQYWMEYSGIIEMGVDAGQLQINEPDQNGTVKVYMPDAKVLSVSADEESFSKPITEKGLFTKLSSKEKSQAYSAAQSKMKQEADADKNLLSMAKENAKLLIEKYIIETGEQIGNKYSVKWIEKPI